MQTAPVNIIVVIHGVYCTQIIHITNRMADVLTVELNCVLKKSKLMKTLLQNLFIRLSLDRLLLRALLIFIFKRRIASTWSNVQWYLIAWRKFSLHLFSGVSISSDACAPLLVSQKVLITASKSSTNTFFYKGRKILQSIKYFWLFCCVQHSIILTILNVKNFYH